MPRLACINQPLRAANLIKFGVGDWIFMTRGIRYEAIERPRWTDSIGISIYSEGKGEKMRLSNNKMIIMADHRHYVMKYSLYPSNSTDKL